MTCSTYYSRQQSVSGTEVQGMSRHIPSRNKAELTFMKLQTSSIPPIWQGLSICCTERRMVQQWIIGLWCCIFLMHLNVTLRDTTSPFYVFQSHSSKMSLYHIREISSVIEAKVLLNKDGFLNSNNCRNTQDLVFWGRNL